MPSFSTPGCLSAIATGAPIDTLSLDLSGVLRAIEPPRGANTFDDRSARLGYQRQGLNTALSFGANYSLSSVEARDPFDRNRFLLDEDLPEDEEPVFEEDPLDETDLSQDRGDREEIGAQFRFETGLNDPLGVVLTGSYRERSFTDTTDPDLFDSETFTLSAPPASPSARSPRRAWCCATAITAPTTPSGPTGRPAASIWA